MPMAEIECSMLNVHLLNIPWSNFNILPFVCSMFPTSAGMTKEPYLCAILESNSGYEVNIEVKFIKFERYVSKNVFSADWWVPLIQPLARVSLCSLWFYVNQAYQSRSDNTQFYQDEALLAGCTSQWLAVSCLEEHGFWPMFQK